MTIRSIDSARRSRLVLSAMVVAAVATCRDPHAASAKPTRKANPSMTYDQAVALLQAPERWCDGAAALVKLGNRRAIGPLFRLVARTEEGLPDRSCVRDALDKLGARDEAVKLVTSADAADRRIGIQLIRECPAGSHMPILVRLALHDPDPDLRSLAARTLRTQKITTAWEIAMIALLDANDSDTRELAATSLQHRFGATILAALRNRLRTEARGPVRGALEAAIHCHEDHTPARP
jgi:hypothetical protein